jgi:hypothetical protein
MGHTLPHYPDAVTDLVLTEPDRAMLRRLARRAARSGRSPRVVRAAAEELPAPDASLDTVVCNLVLCTASGRAGANVIEVAVSGIRRKLGEHAGLLETVRGVGYRWRDGAA